MIKNKLNNNNIKIINKTKYTNKNKIKTMKSTLGLSLAFSSLYLYSSKRMENQKTFCDEDANCSKAAICVLNPAKGSEAKGLILFNQSSYNAPTKIKGSFENLKKNSKHGFHIHEFGDNTDGCISAGPHYNPFNKTHGGIEDRERHVGDFSNVLTDDQGKGTFYFENELVSLSGKYSVVGRTCVLHADEDDLGRGGHADSKTTGHSGFRIACGIIGLADPNKYKL